MLVYGIAAPRCLSPVTSSAALPDVEDLGYLSHDTGKIGARPPALLYCNRQTCWALSLPDQLAVSLYRLCASYEYNFKPDALQRLAFMHCASLPCHWGCPNQDGICERGHLLLGYQHARPVQRDFVLGRSCHPRDDDASISVRRAHL